MKRLRLGEGTLALFVLGRVVSVGRFFAGVVSATAGVARVVGGPGGALGVVVFALGFTNGAGVLVLLDVAGLVFGIVRGFFGFFLAVVELRKLVGVVVGATAAGCFAGGAFASGLADLAVVGVAGSGLVVGIRRRGGILRIHAGGRQVRVKNQTGRACLPYSLRKPAAAGRLRPSGGRFFSTILF